MSKKSKVEGTVLVYADKVDREDMPTFSSKFLPTETYFNVPKDGSRPSQLTTITPSGVHIGWTSCGNCHMHFIYCKCRAFTVPRSIEVACDQDTAILNGEEWTIHHPNYRGSIREKIANSHRRGDTLTKSLGSIMAEPKPSKIKTEYDKKRLDKKVKSQSKRSLSEFKRLVDAPEGSQKKRLKGAGHGPGAKKRHLKKRA